jgi:hypothetical protein
MNRNSDTRDSGRTGIKTIPLKARTLTAIGDKTAEAVEELYSHGPGFSLAN